MRTGTGFFSVLFQTFFSSSFNGSVETLKSGGSLRLLCLLVGLTGRGKKKMQFLHNLCCAPSCSSTAWFHVSAMSQSIGVCQLTDSTQRVTPSSNTALLGSLRLSGTDKQDLVAGQAFPGFFSVVMCSCFGEAPPQASVKCHSCFRCDCEHGTVHKTQTCYLNCVTPEQCPPLNVIALSDK